MIISCDAYALTTGKPCHAPVVHSQRRSKLDGGLSTDPGIFDIDEVSLAYKRIMPTI